MNLSSVGTFSCTSFQEKTLTETLVKPTDEESDNTVQSTYKYRKEVKSQITCVARQLQPAASIDLQQLVKGSFMQLNQPKVEKREVQSLPKLADTIEVVYASSQQIRSVMPISSGGHAIGDNILEILKNAEAQGGNNPYRDALVESSVSKASLVVSGVVTFGAVPAVVMGSECLDRYAGGALDKIEKFLEENPVKDPSESLARCLIGPEECDPYYYALAGKFVLKGAKKVTEVFEDMTKALAKPVEGMLDRAGVTDQNALNLLPACLVPAK